MIAILSVENTGTHFTRACVEQLSGKRASWDTGEHVVMTHVYPLFMDSVTHYATRFYERADKIVVPLRDPLAALISNHDRGHGALSYRDHALAFLRIASWTHDRRVLFWPWDRWERDYSEHMLATHLGFEPKALDWSPRNETKYRTPLRDLPRDDAWDLLEPAKEVLTLIDGFWRSHGYEL